MIYFDNAATGGRKPDNVLTAVNSAIKVCANPGRSGHKLSLSCAKIVSDCRKELTEYFNGYGYDRVIFTKNCTEALNIVILGTLKKGDHVITTVMEHNSVLRPLEYLKNKGIIEYDICPLTDGNISPNEIKKLIKKNTKMVIVTSASNVTGATPPLSQIKDVINKDILFIVDGAQGGGHIHIDMKENRIDALALAGHKGLMGIQGCGALIFSKRINPNPILLGGTGSDSYSLLMPDYYPDKLESGTLSFPAISSLFQGLLFLNDKEKEIQKKMISYTKYFINKLKENNKYIIYSKENPCGIVSFEHKEISSYTLADDLSEKYSICVRGGLHCAPLIHKALRTEENGLVRISFSYFTNKGEIDVLIKTLNII